MPRKPNPPPTDPGQSKKFLETAKALEAEASGVAFSKAIAAIVGEPKGTKKKKVVENK